MTYQIEKTETGQFAVLQLSPVEIARFGSEDHARMFVESVLIRQSARPAWDGGVMLCDATALAAGSIPAENPVPLASIGSAVVPPSAQTPPLEATADAWEFALARVAAGEGCKAVAEEMGLPFGSLRARWAARSKKVLLEDSVAAVETMMAENGQDAGSLRLHVGDLDATRVTVIDGSRLVPVKPFPQRHFAHVPDMPEPRLLRKRLTERREQIDSLSLPDPVEDVRGRPDLVARREPVWTDEIDLEVIEAGDDEEKLWRIAAATGASLEKVKRRQTTLMEQIAREIGR